MKDNENPHDSKIAKFPDSRRRRDLVVLKAANDVVKPEPALNIPPTVKALILCILAVFLAQKMLPTFMGEEGAAEFLYHFAFVPARYTGGLAFGWEGVVSPLSHMFLHAGWLHLGMNVASLMAFGGGLEKWVGGRKLLIIYFISGLCGIATQFLVTPFITNPVIGASGAINGIFGALIVQLHARGHMSKGQGTGGLRTLLPVVAMVIASSVAFAYLGTAEAGGIIAWAVHIGGFLSGMLLSRR